MSNIIEIIINGKKTLSLRIIRLTIIGYKFPPRRRKMKIIKTNPHIINVIRWDYKNVIIR